MTTSTITPIKGMVWKHNRRKEWDGRPMELTVTSVTKRNGKEIVYSQNKFRDKVKTPIEVFDKFCLEVVSMPVVEKSKPAPKLDAVACKRLWWDANKAGMEAGNACSPAPMTVQEIGADGKVTKTYAPIAAGVCGFAWVNVRPGNCSFAKYAKEFQGMSRGHAGGVDIWIRQFGQSYERKMAYARAFAEVLKDAGIEAYASGRLD